MLGGTTGFPHKGSVIRKTFPWCDVSCRVLFNPLFISIFSCYVSDWLMIQSLCRGFTFKWDRSWVRTTINIMVADVLTWDIHQVTDSLCRIQIYRVFSKHNTYMYMCRYIARMYNRSRLVDARPSAIDVLTKRWIYPQTSTHRFATPRRRGPQQPSGVSQLPFSCRSVIYRLNYVSNRVKHVVQVIKKNVRDKSDPAPRVDCRFLCY